MFERAAPRWTRHRFIAFDRTAIAYYRLETPGSPRAVFLIVHGMGEHGGRYHEFADRFAARNIASFMPDLRGFGMSGGKRGCAKSFSDYFQDLDVVYRLTRQAYPGAPVFVLGHSFGGLLVSSWLAQDDHEVRGLVLSSPNFGIAIQVPAWRHWLGLAASSLCPDLTQDNRVNVARLTHDSSLLLASSKDPLIHHRISARLYAELVKWLARTDETAGRLRLPSLVLQAGDDHIVLRSATEHFFQKLASLDKEITVYEGFYHEILNEVGRAEVYSRILSWAEKHLAAHP